jgi:hypothetical protein
MRKLKYSVELPDGTHQDYPALDYPQAESLLRILDWKTLPGWPQSQEGGEIENPYLLFWDHENSFFLMLPGEGGVSITAKVQDKWNLMGFMSGERSFTLEFGTLTLEDSLVLLKLFFEDNYPALRAMEKSMQKND